MGNQQGIIINNLSTTIKQQASNINKDYVNFLERDIKFNSKHITGGISSGISNSEKFITKNNIVIDIWKDISFTKLLKGRKELIIDWIEHFNNKKYVKCSQQYFLNSIKSLNFSNQDQKDAYIRRYMPIEDDLTLEEFKEAIKIPNGISYNKLNNHLKDRIRTLCEKHGYNLEDDIKNLIRDLIDLQLNPKGRCTSGLYTFLKVLNSENTEILNRSHKDFLLSLTLTTTDPKHQEIYDKKIKEIEKAWEEKINYRLKFEYYQELKEGDIVTINSEYFSDIKFKIPEDFLSNYKVGDTIHIFRDDLDSDNKFKINMVEMDLHYPDTKKVNKVKKLRKEYYLCFNLNENNIQSFVENSINEFTNEVNQFDFGEYI